MTKRDLINAVKYNGLLYRLYYYFGSLSLRILGRFVKQKSNIIVFSSFGGRKYDDSPRCIFEAMSKDKRFSDFSFIWALGNPDNFEIPNAQKVKCDTIAYYKALLSARVWITNSTMERGLSFKPRRIFNLNTWHGTPIKLMGSDINKDNASFGSLSSECHDDIMLAQGKYDVDVFSRAFTIPKERFRIIGLPRNDELIHGNTEKKEQKIRAKLRIPNTKKVILYAPTFREYDMDSIGNCKLTIPFNLEKWEEKLGHQYVLLFRAHYEVVKVLDIKDDTFIRNVSSYDNLNELMIVSDLLISDYSSIFFDYSIQDKPMLCFAYDYDKYNKARGMYFDIREKIPNYTNEDNLIDELQHLDDSKHIENTKLFRKEFIESYGDASQQAVELIYEKLRCK